MNSLLDNDGLFLEVNWQLLFFVKWLYKFVKLDKPSSIAATAIN